MSHCKCEAVILRRTRFSETSLIVVMLTREFGRVEALAKGCRREKSPLRGRLDLFNREETMIWQRSRGGLDLVTDTDIISEYTSLRTDATAYAAAGLIGEILRVACMVRDPHPHSFDALVAGLSLLEMGAPVASTVTRMLLAILSDLGFRPRVDACVHCDSELPLRQPLVLSGTRGGFLCASCASGDNGWHLPPRAAAALRYRLTHVGENRVNEHPADTLPFLEALIRYTEDTLGRALKSKTFFVSQLRKRQIETNHFVR